MVSWLRWGKRRTFWLVINTDGHSPFFLGHTTFGLGENLGEGIGIHISPFRISLSIRLVAYHSNHVRSIPTGPQDVQSLPVLERRNSLRRHPCSVRRKSDCPRQAAAAEYTGIAAYSEQT